MTKEIILIDDHFWFRQGIKTCIEANTDWKVIAEAGNFSEAKTVADSLPSQNVENKNIVVIVDLSFKESAQENETFLGFEIVKLFKKTVPFVHCLILSSFDSCGYVQKALSAEVGANGYMSKTADNKTLLLALETISAGKTFIQQELVSNLLELKDLHATFTNKEKEIADLITLENTNSDISEILGIKISTVDNYISRLYDKTGTNSRVELLKKLGR